MESEQQQPTERETAPQHWRSCKLIIDPLLTNGLYKVYRYDGQHFNIPVQDLGVFPVGTVRDPRVCRMWSKCDRTDLLVPKFKIDECYVGPIPPKEVTFSRLNDNVREGFLTDMCKKYGDIEEVEIFYNPKNKKHLGIARVMFDSVKAAKDAAQHLHHTSVMGNIIHVEIDPKGENRMRYLQLLLSGLYTPWTLPVGSNEQTLQSLIANLPGSTPTQRHRNVSSPTSTATPLSLDTAYSSIWQDTPCSFGLTPCSQGSPRTPCLSGTPLSQDSCYSSLQATPVLQGEPSTYSVPKPLRREVCYRKPVSHRGRPCKSSDFNTIFKHFQPQPLFPLPAQTQTTGNSQQPALWGQNAQSLNNTECSFHLAPPGQESREVVTSTSKALPLNCNSLSILSINDIAERQAAVSSPPDYHAWITESSPSAVNASPGSPHPETDSLDSRIEMLLKKSQSSDTLYFDVGALEAAVHPQDSPTSPASDYSPDCTPALGGSPTTSRQPSHNARVDVSPTPLPDNEEDETIQAVASLLRNSQSPTSHLTHIEGRANANKTPSDKDAKRLQSLSCPKELHIPNEDKERSNNKQSILSKEFSSLPQPPPFSSLSSTTQRRSSKPPPATMSGHSHPPVTPFPFPIPSISPSVPLFPVRLPNGTIPFPPPCWIPPPGHHTGIPMPPTPIPPPPTLLGPPPPLIAPPSVAHPVHPYLLHMQPAEHLDKGNPPKHGSAPLSFCGPPWPSLPFPRFSPFVPPPGYLPVRKNPHKVTVEKVLGVIMEELKSIIKKDIIRRMVEGVAFKAFDEWWDCQEKKAKIAVTPLKSGVETVEERTKPIHLLSHIIGQHKKIQLPSFKVKRKAVHDPTTSEELDNVLSSAHENDSHHTNSEVNQGDDIARPTSESAKPVGGGCPALKRRHARPLELDSDDDEEEEEEDDTLKDEEIILGKEENTVPVNDAPKVQRDIGDHDDGDNDDDDHEEEEEAVQKSTKGDGGIICRPTDGVQFSDSETLSETSSSEESECSSDFDSSDSYSSESTDDSSYSDLSSEEDDDTEEDGKVDRSDECVVISSDEESMELEPPVTPSAPLTPGAQLELGLQDWSEGGHREEPEEDQYTSCQHDPSDLDAMREFQTSEHQDRLQPPSPIRLPAVESNFDVELQSPVWEVESLENIENLKPLTPTGSLLDSDPDLLIRSKPMPPAVDEVEPPHTPGQGVAAQLESEDSMDELLSLSPTSSEPVLSPSEPQASYAVYQDMPQSPSTEERSGWTPYRSGRVPATPGRETTLSEGSTARSPPLSSPLPIPSLSNNLYIRTPQTPGRDIVLPRRAIVHRRKTRMPTASQGRNAFSPLLCDESARGSPIVVSSPCSLSDMSAETADGKSVWIGSGARMKPLQGLENMPGLLGEENRGETEKSLMRREQWRWQKMRRRRMRRWQRQRSLKRVTASLSSPSRPHRCYSLCEEMRILHSVWKEGLDEEDARLLQVTYERLQHQDNGFGWLSDTLWIPHPLTRVLTEKKEEHNSWQQNHTTGSARSEGFYTISRRDKMKYLNNTRLAAELPSTSTQQGMCIPAQPPTSSRAGSDFRSEQRRLLSSFSCDSDLVKFNQLKFRKKRIRFCRSHIHDWGLFAMEPIAADEMVIEYVGQTIRQVIADMREKRYEDEGIGSSYLFRVDQDTIIDATKCGNLARFINHSCNPNCYAKIITVESQKKIVIYSRQPININEEITYDYKFPIEDEKIPCLCGADSCRGSLN